VAFPGVALAESLEGWGCGIPPFGFAQGRLLRKVREEWGSLVRGGVGLQQLPFGFAHSRFLAGLSAQFGMTKCVKACGAA
jgi:hypothetical protein